MRTTIDSAGRIVVPKALRDWLGLRTGDAVDISEPGAGLRWIPVGRMARLAKVDGRLVAISETTITDDDLFALIDLGRRCRSRRSPSAADVTPGT